jgi:hypothetical protein
MFTQRKLIILSVAAFGLFLGTCVLFNRSGREAHAQDAKKQPDKDKGQDADRDALAKVARSFAAAFEGGDAKAVAAHWTENGEYVADDGTVIRGRVAIEDDYAGLFAKRKGTVKVEIEVDPFDFPLATRPLRRGISRFASARNRL